MTLLALMYHRALPGPNGNVPEMLDAHFSRVADACRCVLPGEPLASRLLNVCLTFDDGYYDFYAVVYPLLKKHGLRALLAVPAAVVPESVTSPPAARLRAAADLDGSCPDRNGICTWDELGEMARSGRVAIAAHGLNHRRLDEPDVDLEAEIALPQALTASRLGLPVESYVFPYGRFSPAALAKVREHYRYAFRIGEADNSGWDQALLYRVRADGLGSPGAPFNALRRVGYRARRHWNRLRGR
jgi:peptidoglycan/xylan/chitin deacetylase (PgdA/CDA1 family)